MRAAALPHLAWRCLSLARGGASGRLCESECICAAHGSFASSATRARHSAADARIPAAWREAFVATPRVRVVDGLPPPLAISWARRRAPGLSEGALQRLFRQRQVRVLEAGASGRGGDGDDGDGAAATSAAVVKRVSKARVLKEGDVLLLPREALAGDDDCDDYGDDAVAAAAARRSSGRGASVSVSSPPAPQRRRGGDGVTAVWTGLLSRGIPLAPHELASTGCGGDGGVGGIDARTSPPRRQRESSSSSPLTPERVRSWLLAAHRDFFVLNKPAGVAVQPGRRRQHDSRSGGNRHRRSADGDDGAHASLDAALASALQFGAPEAPRLVHRLDLRVSGALVVARGADAAAWLSLCFKGRTAAAAAGFEPPNSAAAARGRKGAVARAAAARDAQPSSAEAAVLSGYRAHRTYWALLQGALEPGRRGTLRSVSDNEGRSGLPKAAVTRYRVLGVLRDDHHHHHHHHGGGNGDGNADSAAKAGSSGGVSWVELRPETGRRHQLRQHCAMLLGAPILGDYRYGYRAPSLQNGGADDLFKRFVGGAGGGGEGGVGRERRGGGADGGERAAAAREVARVERFLRGAGEGQEGVNDAPVGGGTAWIDAGEEYEGQDDDGGRGAAAASADNNSNDALEPLFLHAREIAIHRPRQRPVTAIAPLPPYMRRAMAAAGWRVAGEARLARGLRERAEAARQRRRERVGGNDDE